MKWDTDFAIIDGDGKKIAIHSYMDRGWHTVSGAKIGPKFWDHEQAALYSFARGESNEIVLDSGPVSNPRLIYTGK